MTLPAYPTDSVVASFLKDHPPPSGIEGTYVLRHMTEVLRMKRKLMETLALTPKLRDELIATCSERIGECDELICTIEEGSASGFTDIDPKRATADTRAVRDSLIALRSLLETS